MREVLHVPVTYSRVNDQVTVVEMMAGWFKNSGTAISDFFTLPQPHDHHQVRLLVHYCPWTQELEYYIEWFSNQFERLPDQFSYTLQVCSNGLVVHTAQFNYRKSDYYGTTHFGHTDDNPVKSAAALLSLKNDMWSVTVRLTITNNYATWEQFSLDEIAALSFDNFSQLQMF